MSEGTDSKASALPKERSPTYPYISLDIAMERIKTIYTQIRDHAQPREVVAKAYGKPATSSATIQTFATLLQYGLLENVAGPTGRRMRVSALAQGILNPHAPSEKKARELKKAALNPPIFAELWERFDDTFSLNDSVPLYYLTSERGQLFDGSVFTEKAAAEVLRIYRATLSYAGISNSDDNQDLAEEAAAPLPATPRAKAGDLVQIEINGAFVLSKPKRIESIQEHEGKLWVFLEGEKAAVEMDYVVPQEEKPTGPLPPTRIIPPTIEEELEGEWSEERLIDDGGDEITIRYKGSPSKERYEFIRDYLDFKIQRLAKRPG
ncbi:hypothetical protein QE369_001219 [Agrobacterium larrymoorei]|uniref:Uncharacterized protein n=1 Tax=Agrobacterium larrymoorei TaxID=160699 RepID=A0AAJ2B7W5_9HYPH|nr:hypothetical protein [Agrobacterium larrymoorei]MDR6101041.1 hypothetical protein [Agrobacterium larrymoorei]